MHRRRSKNEELTVPCFFFPTYVAQFDLQVEMRAFRGDNPNTLNPLTLKSSTVGRPLNLGGMSVDVRSQFKRRANVVAYVGHNRETLTADCGRRSSASVLNSNPQNPYKIYD